MTVMLCTCIVSYAQDEPDTGYVAKQPVVFRDKKGEDLHHSKWAMDYKLRTNGWSIGLDRVRSDKKNEKDVFRSFTVYHLGLGYTRAKREGAVRSISSERIKYGKINSLYPIELSIGKRKQLGREAVYEGVEIQWEYKVGLLLGWILPYQISTAYGDVYEYTPGTAIAYTDHYSIYRGLGSFRNLNFETIYPGLIIESNVIFNYPVRKSYHLSPSIGAAVSFYSKSIPLLYSESSGPLFFEIHIGVEFGRFRVK